MLTAQWTMGNGQRATTTAKICLRIVLLAHCSLLVAHCALAESPAAPHFQAGLAYERLGRYEEAYTELQLAFALDQQNPEAAVALGIVACRLGRLDVAQRALERSIAVDSNSSASYYQLALIYEDKNMTERARDAWQRFASLNRDEQLKTVAQEHLQYLEAPAP